MIVLIIMILIVVAGLGYQKYRGNQALTFTHVDVAGLTLNEIVQTGSKASGSMVGRLAGNTPTARRINDGAEWHAQIQGSVMSFSAAPLPDGSGYRVGGVSSKIRIAQTRIGSDRGIWGLSKAISNAIYRMLGIPHNASALVRRRNRVLRAIANSGKVLDSAAARIPAVNDADGQPYGRTI
jgi:hypothetical protein